MRDFPQVLSGLGDGALAMIVCVSREVCVKVHDALAELRPDWTHEAVDKGKMKIVFHGDHSDPKHLRKHALRPSQHRTVKARADRPMQGANLMQTLGRGVDRAITEVRNEHSTICGLLASIDWRALLADTSHPQPRRRALSLVTNHLRDPRTPGNQVEPGTTTLATRFRESATCLERFHRLCAMSREIAERFDDLATWRRDIAFFAEVRAWMVKLDAADREASGKPVAAEVNLYLSQLAASVVEAEEITDLYVMGDDTLAKIARALVADIRKNLRVDWLSREPVRAKLRTRIRRLLASTSVRRAVWLAWPRWERRA